MPGQLSNVHAPALPAPARRSCPIEVRDVTDDAEWSEIAKRTVAHAYSTLASPHVAPEQVYAKFCIDQDGGQRHDRVLAAFAPGRPRSAETFCGTMRLVTAVITDEVGSLPPIDVLQLMRLPHWPHESAGAIRPIVAEICRTVILERYRSKPMRQAGMPECIIRALWSGCMDLAARYGATYVYAIMPTYVVRLLARAGIPVTAVEGSQLNDQDDTARAMFDTFQIYWRHSHPKLYLLSGPATATGIPAA
jgi:hypothetical protein